MDPRFLQEQGTGIFTGNELIVKGALESGIGEITGYPGSPLAEVFETLERIGDLLNENGIVAQIANNEALAAARLNGSQMEKIRAMAVMKSVGMHVAADGLALGNMAGAVEGAGALVVVGDDTWSEGTQVPADSRFLSQHLYIPVMEPATFQEIKDWIGIGFDLSSQSHLFITYLVTSNQADGGGSVNLHANRFEDHLNAHRSTTIDTSTIATDQRVIIPPMTAVKEREVLHQRYPRLLELVRECGINDIRPATESTDGFPDVAFITSGLAYVYLEHALGILGLTGRFTILKLGITYPLDATLISTLTERHKHLCVVEEKRPFVEAQVAAAMIQARQSTGADAQLWGKRFPDGNRGFPEEAGLMPTSTAECVARLLKLLEEAEDEGRLDWDRINAELAIDLDADEVKGLPAVPMAVVPPRSPSFCPGCPHRDSASVIDKMARDFADPEYMKDKQQSTQDLVFHGDIGCYSMLKYPPFSRLMHNLSGMGLGGGTGAGIDPFIDNKQLVFMGDSTFFHTGVTAISDSIKNHQDLTYVILDNKTTAMTGHQPTPGVDVDLLGKPTFAQDIERIVRGLAGDGDTFIARIDPAQRGEYKKLIEQATLRDGVKIIIADKECGITYHRRQRALVSAEFKELGFTPVENHINISEDVCENCMECTRATGCSGLTVTETEYGPKIAIDLSSCVTDGACTRVEVKGGDKTCPSFEEITIHRKKANAKRLEPIDSGLIPLPTIKPLADAWYAYIAGVGGMGVNVITSVLAQAGVRQGYAVQLTNKKGLAIRNGSVYSHLSYAPDSRVVSPVIPSGRAHLLLGLDVLEAARGIDPAGRHRVASRTRTAAALNTAKTPTTGTLIGDQDFSPESMARLIAANTDADRMFGLDLFGISERFLGNKLYANIMLLGAAFQRGLLPLSLENLEWALAVAVRRDLETNVIAFNMGRRLAFDPDYFEAAKRPESRSIDSVMRDRTQLLTRSRGRRGAESYSELCRRAVETLQGIAEVDLLHVIVRLYDLIEYDGPAYAKRYLDAVVDTFERDASEYAYEATAAVIRYLAKVMAIKDEVYVARLLTCEEKYRRDRERYGIDPERGDRVQYRHLTRPHLRLLGRDFRPDVKARDWQLRLLGRMKFLRRLFASWWHLDEVDFREWFAGLVQSFDGGNGRVPYQAWVELLSLPEQVRGYRIVRTPKMQAARERAQTLLATSAAAQTQTHPAGTPVS
jgi:indolepyruvate ferredoxin oxidoreductase